MEELYSREREVLKTLNRSPYLQKQIETNNN